MHVVKVLKRKDASSVIVAVILAVVLLNVLTVLTADLATILSGIETSGDAEWRETIVRPLVQAALQLILLEAVLRIVIGVRPLFVRKKR